MMPSNAGEYTEEGMTPCPFVVRLILVFFAEEQDEGDDLVGGTNPDTFFVTTTEKSATKDVLSFILM